MAIALTDLLDEKQVVLGLRSRKVPNALREIIELLAQNGLYANLYRQQVSSGRSEAVLNA